MAQVVSDTPAQPTASPAVTPLDLRRAAGQFATGVTVVTVRDGDGFRGMTANSFTSVSLDPPLVLVSVDRRNRTHELLVEGEPFVVNVLAEMHLAWSDLFTGRHGDVQHQFDDIPHTLSASGVPGDRRGPVGLRVPGSPRSTRPATIRCSSARLRRSSTILPKRRCSSSAASTAHCNPSTSARRTRAHGHADRASTPHRGTAAG